MNIANHGPEHLGHLHHSQLLPAFLDLIKSHDADMIRLGLGYIELLLTQLPNVNIVCFCTRIFMNNSPFCLGQGNHRQCARLYGSFSCSNTFA